MFNLFKSKSKKCCNGGSEHNFQPRYDECKGKPFTGINVSNVWPSDYIKILESTREVKTTYVKDVCVWCGKEIIR